MKAGMFKFINGRSLNTSLAIEAFVEVSKRQLYLEITQLEAL